MRLCGSLISIIHQLRGIITMKKLIALLIALALVLSLAACAEKPGAVDEPDNGGVTSEPGGKTENYSDRKPTTGSDGGLWTGTTGEREKNGDSFDGWTEDYALGGAMVEAETDADYAVKASAPMAPSDASGYGAETDGYWEMPAPEPEPEPAPGYDVGEMPVDPGEPWEPTDPVYPGDPDEPWEPVLPEIEAEPFMLTAAEWNDNENWPFFTNLVNTGRISFPVYGLDPTHRIKVTVTGGAYASVELLDKEGGVIWSGEADKDGVCYLFYKEGETPTSVRAGGETFPLASEAAADPDDQQGAPVMQPSDEVEITAAGEERSALQIMFIVDTTGSMGDEMLFLQKDFSSIAAAVEQEGTEYSVCFYRDEGDDYVTKVSEFTTDVEAVQTLIESEYATGGGDWPEAVAQILNETLTPDFAAGHNGWRTDAVKVAFMIFDAPPHDGTEAEVAAAVERAAKMGIRLVPVICSNGERETELFGRALAILTGGTYVFLTDDSGIGYSHLEPIIGAHDVEKLHDIIVRIINEFRP